MTLEEEVVKICQDLIRIPSVNFGDGKGDEKAVAEYVVASLAEVGVSSTIYESAPNRCNVVAMIDGVNPDRAGLVVHGHLDVVPANQDGWTVDPFAGVVKEGYVWGRGAVDMKGALAVQVGVIRLLCARARAAGLNPAKDPIPGLRRDIILTATADEETGGLNGIALVLKDRKHWLDAAVGLTEAQVRFKGVAPVEEREG